MQQHIEPTSEPDSLLPVWSAPTLTEVHQFDDLWNQALQNVREKLPTKDLKWLEDEQNQKAFTSTQILEAIQPFQKRYTNHPAQKFLARIDPIVSHIRSFAGSINAFTNTSMAAGMVWGSIYLVLIVRRLLMEMKSAHMLPQVAGKTQRTLEKILDFLSRLSPLLTLFSRWHHLFPQRSFAEVGDAIRDAYTEVIGFCVTAVRHLRRSPMSI
jgi:hypothetical protein